MKPVIVRNVAIGEGIPKICVPIVGRTREEIAAAAEALKGLPVDVVEWRVDWFKESGEFTAVKEVLESLRKTLGDMPLLFTFRTAAEGGEKAIEGDAYRELAVKAAQTGLIDLLDVEVFLGDELVKTVIGAAHSAHVAVIGSNHDFDGTPSDEDMMTRFKKMRDLGADILKLAVMPHDRKDVLRLLTVTETIERESPDHPLITMSMSGTGAISRLCGEVFGSALTFGCVGRGSAPGQIEVRELAEVLKVIHGGYDDDIQTASYRGR